MPAEFDEEMREYFAKCREKPAGFDEITAWEAIADAFPNDLANWLTEHEDFTPPNENMGRVGIRPEHHEGGWNGVQTFRSQAEYYKWLGRRVRGKND